jgi:hypothetical protein
MWAQAILVVALLQGSAGRATIIAKPADPPRRDFHIVYYDEAFLFAARHYGSSGDVGGNTEPGLFVHSKEKNKWIQITAISTADGSFGKSTSEDPDASRRLRMASVGWDFTGFALRPYIDQPLRTSGSIVFPETIEFDSGTGRYELRYLSSWGVPSAETVLYVRRADLTEVFANR